MSDGDSSFRQPSLCSVWLHSEWHGIFNYWEEGSRGVSNKSWQS